MRLPEAEARAPEQRPIEVDEGGTGHRRIFASSCATRFCLLAVFSCFWGEASLPVRRGPERAPSGEPAWPWLERRRTGDHTFHNLLDRPRDAPWGTAIGAALATYRVLVWVVPAVVLFVTLRVCRELREGEQVERRRRAAEHAARMDV
jgi:hypothetical protein